MTKINCILIDDETEALDRLESLLEKFDYVKVLAKIDNPTEAVKRIIKLNPNLIFIDVEMPRINGFDIVKEIRKQKLNPTFIFVTGYNQYAIKAIRTAAFDFLLKPVDIDELKEALERFIKSKKERKLAEIKIMLTEKHSLTNREVEIAQLVAKGKTSKEIAKILFISKNTVDTHRRNTLKKIGKKSISLL